MKLWCKHMAKQHASGYKRKVCKDCPARAKIAQMRSAVEQSKR